jgi:hypothetical protein
LPSPACNTERVAYVETPTDATGRPTTATWLARAIKPKPAEDLTLTWCTAPGFRLPTPVRKLKGRPAMIDVKLLAARSAKCRSATNNVASRVCAVSKWEAIDAGSVILYRKAL